MRRAGGGGLRRASVLACTVLACASLATSASAQLTSPAETPSPAAQADASHALTLHGAFAEHMVVQAGLPLPVWGRAAPRERVTVHFAGQTRSVNAGASGRWGVLLDAPVPGGPHTLLVRGADHELRVDDVLAGEVWIAAGGANMEFPLKYALGGVDLAKAAQRPRLRVARVPASGAGAPRDDVALTWEACTPRVAAELSAVAYAFAARLQDALGVPVGVVQATFPFSRAAAWIPRDGLDGVPALASLRDRSDAVRAAHRAEIARVLDPFEVWVAATRAALAEGGDVPEPPRVPRHPLAFAEPDTSIFAGTSGLYHGMIAPLVPFSVRGVIWHQGEQDLGTGAFFAELQRGVVEGWRGAWRRPRMPWLAVQLSPYRYGRNRRTEKPEHDLDTERLPELWEAQLRLLALPGTGLASVSDLGDTESIFQPDKAEVGRRLAAWALALEYDAHELPHAFPRFAALELLASGNDTPTPALRARLHDAEGLRTRTGDPPRWVEIAGDDGVFVRAQVRLDGASVIAWSPEVVAPRQLRYAWHQEAQGALVNAAGLPAWPFRASLR